jgi:PAS domain S-box-containing protein
MITEEKVTHILENIQDGYYEVDLDGNYTFFNEGLLRITGYSRREMLGMNNRRIVDAFNNKKVFAVFHQVFLTGVPAHAFDWECIRKDGTRRFVEVSVTLKRDANGRPAGFMGIARDITQRKLAEHAIRASEERYRTIIENIEDGYYEVDLKGCFTFFNDAMVRIAGRPRGELLGSSYRQVMDETTAKNVFQLFNSVYLTGVPARAADWELTQKDGSRRSVEVSISLRKGVYGEPVGFMGIARDITDRKHYLAELEAKEIELNQKNRSLAEANTALNVIMKRIEENRLAVEQTVRSNLNELVLPHVQQAREKTRERAALESLHRLEESLNTVLSPTAHDLVKNFPSLTSTEIDVANFIMQGKRTKEIADILGVTPKAIEVHRNNLRRKFGLTHRKSGLRTHLLSFS